MQRTIRNDDGFSLTELLVVVVLMGVVLAAAYGVFSLTVRARENNERDAYVTTALVVPLQSMTVVLSQNTKVDPRPASDEFQLSCYTDQDADGVEEKHVYTVVDGNLQDSVYSVDGDRNPTALIRTINFGTARTDPPALNTNGLDLPAKLPIFTYYSRDASGSQLPTSAPEGATEVVVTLRSRYAGRDYQDARTVMFRNERTD